MVGQSRASLAAVARAATTVWVDFDQIDANRTPWRLAWVALLTFASATP
jgi:hypothetical protein